MVRVVTSYGQVVSLNISELNYSVFSTSNISLADGVVQWPLATLVPAEMRQSLSSSKTGAASGTSHFATVSYITLTNAIDFFMWFMRHSVLWLSTVSIVVDSTKLFSARKIEREINSSRYVTMNIQWENFLLCGQQQPLVRRRHWPVVCVYIYGFCFDCANCDQWVPPWICHKLWGWAPPPPASMTNGMVYYALNAMFDLLHLLLDHECDQVSCSCGGLVVNDCRFIRNVQIRLCALVAVVICGNCHQNRAENGKKAGESVEIIEWIEGKKWRKSRRFRLSEANAFNVEQAYGLSVSPQHRLVLRSTMKRPPNGSLLQMRLPSLNFTQSFLLFYIPTSDDINSIELLAS